MLPLIYQKTKQHESYKLTVNEKSGDYSVILNTALDMNVINDVAAAYINQKGSRYFKSTVAYIMNGNFKIEAIN